MRKEDEELKVKLQKFSTRNQCVMCGDSSCLLKSSLSALYENAYSCRPMLLKARE